MSRLAASLCQPRKLLGPLPIGRPPAPCATPPQPRPTQQAARRAVQWTLLNLCRPGKGWCNGTQCIHATAAHCGSAKAFPCLA